MLPLFSKKFEYSYSSLPYRENDEPSATGSPKQWRCAKIPHIPQAVKVSIYSLMLMLIGFFLGYSFAQHQSSASGPLVLSVKPHKFEMKPVFGDKPSKESNAAWGELFPVRGGFFNHPTIAPKRSAYAVFHQLHCLVSVWTPHLRKIVLSFAGWPSSSILVNT